MRNRRPLATCAVLLAALLVLTATPLFSAPQQSPKCKSNEILVKFRSDMPAQGLAHIYGTRAEKVIPGIDMHCLRLPPGLTVSKAIALFSRHPNVVYAGPNHIIEAAYMPDDYFFDFQWGLYNPPPRYDVHAPEAWDLSTGSQSITIAIIDTGIDSFHPEFSGRLVPGYNAIDGGTDTEDDHFHGTFVAGVAGATGDNYDGIAGMDWSAKLMPIKVLDASGYGDEADAADGIVWAVDHGAKIINMSLGTYDHVPALEDAVNYAWDHGCAVVCASGNDDLDDAVQRHYPSYYPATISVGATNEYDQRCTAADWLEGGSNYGDSLDVMAPGNNILSSTPLWYEGLFYWLFGEPYEIASGTSAAAPFASGLAGLIWAAHPTWTNQQVRDQIEQTSDDLESAGWDRYTGWGRINAYRALSEVYQPYPTIASIKTLPLGSLVSLPAKPVIAGTVDFTDRFYIEEADRSAGVMVYCGPSPSTPTSISDLAEVSGKLALVEGQFAIAEPKVIVTGTTTPVGPLAMTTRFVGGQYTEYGGVTGGIGLTNTGLLIKTFGRVTAVGWNYFYIDDGCGLNDGSGFTGLKVYSGSLTRPDLNRFVSVTGVSTFEIPPGTSIRIRVIRPRIESDIFAFN